METFLLHACNKASSLIVRVVQVIQYQQSIHLWILVLLVSSPKASKIMVMQDI